MWRRRWHIQSYENIVDVRSTLSDPHVTRSTATFEGGKRVCMASDEKLLFAFQFAYGEQNQPENEWKWIRSDPTERPRSPPTHQPPNQRLASHRSGINDKYETI